MTIMEAVRTRHSVRQYLDQPLSPEETEALTEEVRVCNRESGLHIQFVTGEPKAFSGFLAHYGRFSGVANYFALAGKAGADLQEKCGYWGERLVLQAQRMGLNTCWVALSFTRVKSAYTLERGEKLAAVIAVGHGVTQGTPHKSKGMDEVVRADGPLPDWFRAGMDSVLLAPTALNQQKFLFTLADGKVSAQATGGFFSKIDLGIVRYHFEIGAGTENFGWG